MTDASKREADIVVQSLSHVRLFATLWTAACQASLSFTITQSLFKLMAIESVMTSNHLILCCPFNCFQSFPGNGLFQWIGSSHPWPKYWRFNFINIPSDEYLGLVSFRISLQSKGLSRVPTPQLKSINSSALSFLYTPTLTSIHDHWKNHSFDYADLCQQSAVSAF